MHRLVLFLTFGVFSLALHAEENTLQPPSYSDEKNLSAIRFLNLTEQLKHDKLEAAKDATPDSSNRMLTILKMFKENTRRSISPKVFKKEQVNTFQLASWSSYWQAGFGRTYITGAYEIHIFFYGEQYWSDLPDHQLIQQSSVTCSSNPDGCIEKNTYDDLNYTLSTFGLGSTIYYLRNNTLALGLEVPLLAGHQLRINSQDAKENYRINGMSFMTLPIQRHTIVTPIKLRYRPAKWFGITLSVKYAYMTIYQQGAEDYDEKTEGDLVDNCKSENCAITATTANLGMELIF